MLIASNNLPHHVIPKKLAGGVTGFYWNPHVTLLSPIGGRDCPLKRQALGTDLATMQARADVLNRELAFWRLNGRLSDEAQPKGGPSVGTFDHMLQTYRGASPLKKKSYANLKPKTRNKFDYMVKRFANTRLKDGSRVGDQLCTRFDAPFVDALYNRLALTPPTLIYGPPPANTPSAATAAAALLVRPGSHYFDAQGDLYVRNAPIRRTINEMMAYCRSAWDVSARATPKLVPAANPFAKMGLDHTMAETRPAEIDQLEAFEQKALEMGQPVPAFVARAAWELLQRPEEIINTFARNHWRPADNPMHAYVGNEKTGEKIWKRVAEADPHDPTAPPIAFYPELEAIIQAVPTLGPMMCSFEFRKGPKPKNRADDRSVVIKQFSVRLLYRHAEAIREAAGLPDHCTLASFRHGGMTECGDGGLSDQQAQALSRHKKRETLSRYVHRTDKQVTDATKIRLAYRRGQS